MYHKFQGNLQYGHEILIRQPIKLHKLLHHLYNISLISKLLATISGMTILGLVAFVPVVDLEGLKYFLLPSLFVVVAQVQALPSSRGALLSGLMK